MADFSNFAELMGMYNSTLPTLTDGEASALQLSSDGHLLVTFSNTTIAVTGTFWPATQPVSGTVAVTQSTSPWVVSADGGSFAVTQGTDSPWSIDDNGGSLTVDNNGTFAVQAACTGTFWPSAYFAVDSAAGATDLGVHVLAVRDDALGTLTEADGDYSRLRVNSQGALWVAGSVSVSNLPGSGAESDLGSDEAGDGLVPLTAGPDILVSIPVPTGTLKVSGWSWSSDKQCTFRLEVYDDTTLVKIVRTMLNSGSIPSDSMEFPIPVEVAGGTNIVVRVSAMKVGGGTGGSAAAGINAELV